MSLIGDALRKARQEATERESDRRGILFSAKIADSPTRSNLGVGLALGAFIAVIATVAGGATETSRASVCMVEARLRTAADMVAEKSRFWRAGGSRFRMRRMSGRKPMSNMWSASSSTTTSAALRL